MLNLCAVGSAAEAARTARTLIEKRLAACVQVSPIESWFRWEGRIEQASEHRLHIKTAAARAGAATARLRALHGYALPEIVTLPILHADPDYLAWVKAASAG